MNKLTPSMVQKASGHQYEFVPGTNIREPLFGREDVYRPWEAPPTARLADSPEVAKHQADVSDMHAALFELAPRELSSVSEEFVRLHLLPDEKSPGFQGNYEARLMVIPQLELSQEEFAEYEILDAKVENGTATMAEIKRHAVMTGRRSAELGMLRTIGGFRSEYEKPMMDEAYHFMGEHFRRGTRRKLAVTGFDANFFSDKPIEAFSFGFKRTLGSFPDGNEVSSRTTFTVDVNPETGFDPSLRDAIQDMAQTDWSLVTRFERPKALMQEILRKGAKHPRVMGSVVKLYMFNRSIDETLKERTAQVNSHHIRQQQYGATLTNSGTMLSKADFDAIDRQANQQSDS